MALIIQRNKQCSVISLMWYLSFFWYFTKVICSTVFVQLLLFFTIFSRLYSHAINHFFMPWTWYSENKKMFFVCLFCFRFSLFTWVDSIVRWLFYVCVTGKCTHTHKHTQTLTFSHCPALILWQCLWTDSQWLWFIKTHRWSSSLEKPWPHK